MSGVNIVAGWQSAEYEQTNIWLGSEYFGYRYDYAQEYVQAMKELWVNGQSDFNGKHFTMNDCKLLPKPSNPIKIVAAEQSPRGTKFAAEYADCKFCGASGHNNLHSFQEGNLSLVEEAKEIGRDVGAMVLFTIIAYETDGEAWAKWDWCNEGVDLDTTSWVAKQATKDVKADASAMASRISRADNPVNINGGASIGSFEKIAGLLDEAAEVAGTKGIILIFDNFLIGLDSFGQRIQPLMKSRGHISASAPAA